MKFITTLFMMCLAAGCSRQHENCLSSKFILSADNKIEMNLLIDGKFNIVNRRNLSYATGIYELYYPEDEGRMSDSLQIVMKFDGLQKKDKILSDSSLGKTESDFIRFLDYLQSEQGSEWTMSFKKSGGSDLLLNSDPDQMDFRFVGVVCEVNK